MEVIFIKVGFIGAGKVGFSLGKYLILSGVEVIGYYSRKLESAKEAADFTNTQYFIDVESLVKHIDLLFITIPDDEIYILWQSIKHLELQGKIICHTSGSISSNIFSDFQKSEIYPYSIHPIFPISDKYSSYKKLNEAIFTIEGHDKYRGQLIRMFESMGNKIISINSEDKRCYHLAAVTVSNLFLALINRSCSYLMDYGFNEGQAIEAMMPLIKNTFENVENKGVEASITGPVERCDLTTIKRHLEAMPEVHRETYKNLSLELLQIAEKKNKNRNYEELRKLL